MDIVAVGAFEVKNVGVAAHITIIGNGFETVVHRWSMLLSPFRALYNILTEKLCKQLFHIYGENEKIENVCF